MLFRVILDLVGELERHDRAMAARIRRSAIQAYSTSWDRTQQGRLEQLEIQLRRRLDKHQGSGRGRFRAS